MHDIHAIDERPTPLTVGDTTYQLYDLSWHDLATLQAWVDSKYRDPRELVTEHLLGIGARLPIEVQKFMVREAIEMARRPKPLLGMAEASAQLLSVEGLQQIVLLSIRKGDPTFSDADAEALFRKLTFDHAAEVVERTGILSIKDRGEADGPKAPAPATTAGA